MSCHRHYPGMLFPSHHQQLHVRHSGSCPDPPVRLYQAITITFTTIFTNDKHESLYIVLTPQQGILAADTLKTAHITP